MNRIKITINNEEIEFNLLNDFLFSKIFGEKGCEEELLYLINTFTGKEFKSLSYNPNELRGIYKGNKKSIVDVFVEMDDGTFVSIESQIREQKDFHKRTHFYSSKIYSIYLDIGEEYEKLPLAIMISLLGFNFKKIKGYHSIFTHCDKNNRECTIDDISETHYITLPKFRKEIKNNDLDLNNPEVRLMLLLDKETPQDLFEKVIKMDKVANKIHKKAQHVLQDKISYMSYVRAQQAEYDRKAQMKFAEEKGLEKGLEKGKNDKNIEVVLNSLKENIPIETISKITGLQIKEIEDLKKEIQKQK